MPAIIRMIKQVSYAGIALALLVIIVFLFILPRLDLFDKDNDPGTDAVSIIVESADVVSRGDKVDLVARIRNPNPSLGVTDYQVIFVLLDRAGKAIREIPEQIYLLPGSLNYVAMLDVPTTPTVTNVRVDLPKEPVFSESPNDVSIPTFNSFLRERRIATAGGQAFEVQKGIVRNTSTLGYQVVDVTGVALDMDDKVVGVGKTFIGELQAGEQREFTLQWPKPVDVTQKVIVLPATNIYREDNILRTVGDPGLLR